MRRRVSRSFHDSSAGDFSAFSLTGCFTVFSAGAVEVPASGLVANDFATSAATCGCMARIGDGAVIGSSERLRDAPEGTENRS